MGTMLSRTGTNHKTRRPSPQPEGHILVEATPSNSDGSQSQPAQPFDEYQRHGQQAEYGGKAMDGDDVASQPSGYESSFPSSSYERLLNGERDPDADVREFEATQICTQPDVGMDESLDIPAENTNTHPRSLLSTVNSNVKWRYQKFQDNAPGRQQHSAQNPATSGQSAQAAISFQETQLVLEEAESTIPPRRQFPKPTRSTALPLTPNSGGGALTPFQNNDQMDIVPDSDPPQDNRPRRAAHVPSKTLVRLDGNSSDVIPSSGEIVSDSVAVDRDEGRAASEHQRRQRGDVTQRLHSGKEQEIDDDDDDDVPLAMTSNKRANGLRSGQYTRKVCWYVISIPCPNTFQDEGSLHLNKGNAPGRASQLKQKRNLTNGAPIMDQGKQTTSLKLVRKDGQLSETTAIPSSIPGEEAGKALPSGRRLRANSKAVERVTKSTHGDAKKRLTSTRARVRGGGVHEQHSPSEDELVVDRTSVKDEEDGTDPADDDYAEVDRPVAGPSTRKRKRGPTAPKPTTSKVKSKVSTKSIKRPSGTPITRQGKRLRTASVTRSASKTPTRVFALWKHDGHYYPGVVQSYKSSTYLVRFDDETEATVKIDQMRLCELRVGDSVLFPNGSRSCKVVDVAKFDSDDVVSVSVEDEIEELHVSDLVIANKTIIYAWKDRTLTPDSIVPVMAKSSPTPSKLSIAGGPSIQRNQRKLLAKTGLVITLSSATNKWGKDKDTIMAAVKNTGGTVIDDWGSIFQMEGKHSHSNNKWVIEKSDVRWIGKDDIEKVFLLSDNANQKPKFLIALGLGIPCVNVSWLHDSVNAVSRANRFCITVRYS